MPSDHTPAPTQADRAPHEPGPLAPSADQPLTKEPWTELIATVAAFAVVLLAVLFLPATWWTPVALAAVVLAASWSWVCATSRQHREELNTIAKALLDDPYVPDNLSRTIISRVTQRDEELESRLERLASQRAGLSAVLDAVHIPVMLLAPNSRVLLANPAAQSLVGWTGGITTTRPLIGQHIEDVMPIRELLALADQAQTGTIARARIRIVVDDRPRFFDTVASPTVAGLIRIDENQPTTVGGISVALCLEEVTELAESVQLKTDFAANASHELRTPIAAIRGAIETLDAAKDDPDMFARLVNMIDRHANRLEELVSDLLDLSRLESAPDASNNVPVNAHTLADTLANHFADLLDQAQVAIHFDLHKDLDNMVTDPGVLELVLRNLIDNALKFARPNTAIEVIGRPSDVPPAPAEIGVAAPPYDRSLTGARFRVVDHGAGIPLRDQQRIFERFYQVDPTRDGSKQRRGTGLGLAIVKHAIRRLGGRIDVQSVLNEGTTMSFELPHCVVVPSVDSPSPRAS